MSLVGRRLADEPVYLKEDRFRKPKELFKVVGKMISDTGFAPGSSLLEAGCATGEFLYYIKEQLPHFGHFYGFDISKKMIERARANVPGVAFSIDSVLDKKISKKYQCDVVVCLGVLSIFDDIEKPLKNLLSCVKRNGIIFIMSIFNDDPIDVLMRYRRVGRRAGEWETGWNIVSLATVGSLLRKTGYRLKWSCQPFRLPFPMKKRPEDPMRAWTISTRDNPHQPINGACQLVNLQILKIQRIG